MKVKISIYLNRRVFVMFCLVQIYDLWGRGYWPLGLAFSYMLWLLKFLLSLGNRGRLRSLGVALHDLLHYLLLYTDLRQLGRVKRKSAFKHAQNCGFISSCACAKSQSYICSRSKHSIIFRDYVCGQRMLWLACVDAQADLGFRCPHIPEDMFSHDEALLLYRESCCRKTEIRHLRATQNDCKSI